jgi:hypothetical protein
MGVICRHFFISEFSSRIHSKFLAVVNIKQRKSVEGYFFYNLDYLGYMLFCFICFVFCFVYEGGTGNGLSLANRLKLDKSVSK